MKTFKEAQGRIQTFQERLNEKEGDEKGLLKDLENLGVKETTFSREEIQSAWDMTIDEPTLSDPDCGFYEINETPEFSVDVSEHEAECDIEVQFKGTVEVDRINEGDIIKAIMDNLESYDDDYDQKRWTWDQVEEALGDIYWEHYILADTSEVEAEIIHTTSDANRANIEYAIKEGSYFISVDMDGLNGDLEDNLNSIIE